VAKINFPAIKRASLDQIRQLVCDWLPGGKFEGPEYVCRNPTRADAHVGSFKVNVAGKAGLWVDFATGDIGTDMIDLYQFLHGIESAEAAVAVAEICGVEPYLDSKRQSSKKQPTNSSQGAAATKKPTRAVNNPPESDKDLDPKWLSLPAPANVTAVPRAHMYRGLPEAIYTYKGLSGELLGYMYRYTNSEGGKELYPLVWARHEKTKKCDWRWMQWTQPRPLYGLDRLAAKPEATLFIVEGEKCADFAHESLPDLAVLSWPGGGKVPDRADWSPCAGRRVVIWPDTDSQRAKRPKDAPADFVPDYLPLEQQPGYKTAQQIASILAGFDCTVFVMDIDEPGVKKNGWDIVDAAGDGLDSNGLAEYIKTKSRRFKPDLPDTEENKVNPPLVPACAGGGNGALGSGGDEPPADDEPRPGQGPWWSDDLLKKSNGAYEPCMSNIGKILRHHPLLKGCIRYNEFAQSYERHNAPWNQTLGDWQDSDDLRFNEWLVDNLNLVIKSQSTIKDGVSLAADYHRYHPLKDYLNSLPAWDGVDRLDYWLAEVTDSERSEYLKLAGRFFIMGMIARAFRPGCKFDYCLVLEGSQGQGKSTLFRALAEPWFSESAFEINTNEGIMAIQGVWLHEFAEMGQFNRAEDRDFKQFMTVVSDKFRRPYDKRPIVSPRCCVFGGTTNLDQYLRDMTGNRRIWPLRCTEIDIEWLREHKELLFAEAIHRVNSGERYYPAREEEDLYFVPEQNARLQDDQWIELLDSFINNNFNSDFNWFPTNYLLIKGCGIERQKIDPRGEMSQRLGRVMAAMGWVNVKEPSPRCGVLRRRGFLRPLEQRRIKSDFEKYSTPSESQNA